MSHGIVIAILGAESTGKTLLSRELASALAAEGRPSVVVPETLREFCAAAGRTPRVDEQAGLADAQNGRIDAAAAANPVVIADTTGLQTAVYSEFVFGDRSLYLAAEAWQRRVDLTLLTALDLPWEADGLMRDGPHVREPVDALLRSALGRAGVPFAVVCGRGAERTRAALAAVRRAIGVPADASSTAAAESQPAGSQSAESQSAGSQSAESQPAGSQPADALARWQRVCERCGDPDCERHWLPKP